MSVSKKTSLGPIDGTPEKRMFWSIISDYDLKTGLCELIDNAIDIWLRGDSRRPPVIKVILDVERQLISVKDNAGGVRLKDLYLLLSPGGSKNDPAGQMIGIFGVGSKRAGVALGEQVEIRTRYASEQSLQLDITREWLISEDWELEAYEIPDIERSSTQVDISHLRRPFVATDIGALRRHFGQTYSSFIKQGCIIELNEAAIEPEEFDGWAYPKGYAPKHAKIDVEIKPFGSATIDITVGLVTDRVAEEDNYGAYFYCNERLIVKELKSRPVGYFNSGEAGVPHPDASLCRGIIKIIGPARLMPWNSTKSGINADHVLFQHIRPTLVPLMGHFSTLSRRFKDDWEKNVFKFKTGKVEDIEPAPSGASLKSHLPPVPRAKRPAIEKLKANNKRQIESMPWTLGLVEAIGAVDVIERQSLETKSRIALILLDSNFEIALKEFIVHRTDLFPESQYGNARIAQLFSDRRAVIKEITSKVHIPQELMDKVRHYYLLRNKFIHERATVDVAPSDVKNYKSVVQKVLRLLFDLRL
jgi:hypothetical protein